MKQKQIQQLFQQRYNQQRWKEFLAQTFTNARLYSTPDILLDINTDVATQALQLGNIKLNENGIERNIAVYDVTLASGIVLERNRVGLRNLLRKFWKDIDGAFIVFHRGGVPSWRFTYVSELKGFDAEGEWIEIKTEPKRYTYVLGELESCRTASERFALVAEKGNDTTLDDIKEAFSVEKLSKSFFDEYKKQYELFCEYMITQPSIFHPIFESEDKSVRDFTKKMLGRIVFLFFIQKKGWMGVPENEEWGKGDLNYLGNLFNNCSHPELFYSEYLCKLFFSTLNTQRPNDIAEIVTGDKIRIPFLNGGLFEEDNPKHRNLIFPKKLFSDLFDFFNQYNFTIYEDDPNDQTVAVDPEMLGHIFENLLEDNKDKGAYYTPKEIVHYMCQESLIEYLSTHFEGKGYAVTNYHASFDKQNQPELFPVNQGRKGQLKLEATTTSKSKEIDRVLIEKLLKQKLDDADKELVLKHAHEFNKALDKVKICDPAIGSGAFPMGLLKEIFNAKQTLHTFKHGNTKGFDASTVKLNIIQNSIYGVDIEKGAVDIARLRFWLSLVVDEEAPKALPNLDYKIVVGNSLVSKLGDDIIDIDWTLDRTNQGLFGAELADQKKELLKNLSQEQKEFFNPKSDKKKLAINIRNLKIDILINQLELMVTTNGIETQPASRGEAYTKQTELYLQTMGWKNSIKDLQKLKLKPDARLKYFDWKLDFPEVLNPLLQEKNNLNIAKCGFDIVIGNPPYGAKLSSLDREFIKIKYETAKTIRGVQKASLDTFTLFIEIGHNLTNKGGNLHYIVPISVTSSDSMTGVHRLIEKDCSIIKVSSYAVRPQPVFENAVVNTSILYFKKDGNPCQKIYSTKMYRKNNELNLRYLVENLEFINVFDYKIRGRYPKISLDIERKILSKILSLETNIGNLIKRKGNPVYYRTTGGRYYKVITNYSTGSTKEKAILFDKFIANSIGAILSSNLYFWFYQIFSNNLDLKKYEIEVFGIPTDKLKTNTITILESVYSDYLKDIEKNVNIRQTENYANIDSFKEYKIGKSKHLIDKIDDIIGPLYGLTNEEIKFIKEYEIEFRLQTE